MAVTINGTTGILAPDIGIDGTTLIVDEVNNRVGIGDSSPIGALSVAGNIYSTADQFQGENAGVFFSGWNDYGAGVYGRNSGNDLVMNAGSGERLRITSGGNVQVNGGNVHIDDNGEFAIFEQDTSLAMNNSSKISMDFASNVARIRSSHNGSAVSRPLAFFIGSSEKVRITSGGTLDFKSADGVGINFRESGYINIDSDNDDSNRNFSFYDAKGTGSEKHLMILTDAGKVGIDNSNPNAKLEVKGSGGSTGLTFRGTDSSGNTNFWVQDGGRVGVHYYPFSINQDYSDSATPASTYFYIHGNSPFIVKSDGNVGIGTDSPPQKLTVKGTTSFMATNSTNVWMAYTYTDNTFRLNYNGAGADEVTIDSAGKVGVGTSAPTSKLEVKDTTVGGTPFKIIGANNYDYQFQSLSSGGINGTRLNFYIGSGAGAYSFSNSTIELLRIDNAGNVGIGQTSPNRPLEIQHPSYISKDVVQPLIRLVCQSNDEYSGNKPSAGVGIEFTSRWTGGAQFGIGRIGARGSQSYDGTLQFDVAQNTGNNQFNYVTAMQILKTKQVTIGTDAPPSDAELTVRGPNPELSLYASANYSSFLMMGDVDDYDNGYIEYDNHDPNRFMRFVTNGSTVMKLRSYHGSGNAYSPQLEMADGAGMYINGSTGNQAEDNTVTITKTNNNDWALSVRCYQGDSTDYGMYSRVKNGTTYALAVYDHDNSAWRFRVNGSGTIYAANTTVASISDQRLKENIVDANSQWDDIKALRFRNYKWKEESGYADGKTYLGLIAQEVETISPGLVEINAQTKEDIENEVPDPEHKNVKYSIVWMKAMKALQEAMERIETLEERISSLEGS